MFPPKKPPMATSSKGAIGFLTKKSEATKPEGQPAESGGMKDPAYAEVHELVTKYGKDAVQAALEKCASDEEAETSDAGAGESGEAY